MLQRGGLSGGSTLADSKTIYPINVSETTADSAMYVYLPETCYIYHRKAEGLELLGIFNSVFHY